MTALQAFPHSLSMTADHTFSKGAPITDSEDECGAFALDSSSSNDSKKESSPFQTAGTASTSVVSFGDLQFESEKSIVSSKHFDIDARDKTGSTSTSGGAQYEYLQFIEPLPVTPPEYETLVPGGCPRFPITDRIIQNEQLPEYTPAVYKITLCTKKQECISPFESSPNRSWRNVIVELNSTQLNFYTPPSHSDFSPQSLGFGDSTEPNDIDSQYSSTVTTDLDRRCFQLCKDHGFFASVKSVPSTHKQSDKNIKSTKVTDFRQKNLLRTYSLQHAKIGLASDYSKKPNVLRLRVEHEQFLLEFRNSKDLIDWNLGLSIGKDLALDIAEREAPKYRTVPRRRRNYINTNTPFFNEVARRKRAQSDSQFAESNSRLRDKFSRFKNRLASSSSSQRLSPSPFSSSQSLSQHMLQNRERSSSLLDNRSRSSSRSDLDNDRVRASFTLAADDDDSNGERSYPHCYSTYEEYGYDDIRDTSEAARSEDDDDCDPDIEDLGQIDRSFAPSVSEHREDIKWNPGSRQESSKRYIRNGLKCIRPLNFEDSWVNKSIVKPTTLTPLTAAYLRCIYFEFSSRLEGSTVPSFSSFKSQTQLAELTLGAQVTKKSTCDDHFSLPDNSLAKIPHHSLKEYIVGPHSLIPKYV